MRKGKPGRIPTDIAGAPNRESQIRQDEREKVLKLLENYIKEFAFEQGGDNGYSSINISVDHLEKWFIEELRQEGKDGE
jgi:hypothetical protein